jgi:hypothetical protein
MTCLSVGVWRVDDQKLRSLLLSSGRRSAGVGEEDLRRDRRGGDLDPLVCGPVAERARDQPGVDRKTLRKYTTPAVAAGMTPGGSRVDEAQWRRLVLEWFPQLVDQRLRQVSWPRIELHRDYVAAQLAAGGDGRDEGLEVLVAAGPSRPDALGVGPVVCVRP